MTYRCAECGAFNRVPDERPAGTASCGRCTRPLELSGKPQEVDGEALDRALRASPVPVLVDFWAPWCAPCRAAGPVFEQFGRTHAGQVLVLKLNTESSPPAAARYGIRGIPTFIAFDGGAERARRSGLLPLPELTRWVQSVLSGGPGAHPSMNL